MVNIFLDSCSHTLLQLYLKYSFVNCVVSLSLKSLLFDLLDLLLQFLVDSSLLINLPLLLSPSPFDCRDCVRSFDAKLSQVSTSSQPDISVHSLVSSFVYDYVPVVLASDSFKDILDGRSDYLLGKGKRLDWLARDNLNVANFHCSRHCRLSFSNFLISLCFG